MKEALYHLFEQTQNTLSMKEILTQIIVSALLGFVIYFSYYISHTGTIYSKKFNTTLVVLTILTATVMTVIGNNIALSLGMVGALSIVRFRTAIKDSRDTAYIFWTIIVGICCGVGDYMVAALGSAVVFVVLLLLGRIRNDSRMLLVIRGQRSTERRIESLIFQYFNHRANLRAKNSTQDTIELIYELSQKDYQISDRREKTILEELYQIEYVEYANLVMQSDEISG